MASLYSYLTAWRQDSRSNQLFDWIKQCFTSPPTQSSHSYVAVRDNSDSSAYLVYCPVNTASKFLTFCRRCMIWASNQLRQSPRSTQLIC